MPEKIHCDLFDIIGPDWTNITEAQANCIVDRIKVMELLGEEGVMYGFVGTTSIGNIVGGFFAIQLPAEFLEYDRRRSLSVEKRPSFEQLFFVLFPASGRVLLQNRRFRILPIDMSAAVRRFQVALATVLQDCRVGFVLNLAPPRSITTRAELISLYEASERVERLTVVNPAGNQIPDDVTYYNPQRQRNRIILDSQRHDSDLLRKIDIEAQDGANLKNTHLAKGYIHAVRDGEDFFMVATVNGVERYIRQEARTKFELLIDTDAKLLAPERLQEVIAHLRREAGIDLDTPVGSAGPRQMSIYDYQPGEDSEDDEQEDVTR